MKYLSSLLRGDFGLAKTYWIWGFVGSAVWVIGLNLTIQDRHTGAPTPLLVAFLVYVLAVLVGVWNAARKYAGPAKWKRSAMMLTIMGGVIWAAMVWAAVTR